MAAPAGAATKPYSVVVSPGSITQGVTVKFQAKFTNLTASQTLGSANLKAPAGFSVVGPHVTVLGRDVVELRNLDIAPGASFIATVTAAVPSSNPCVAPASFTWDVAAKQSNDFNGTGNDFGPLVSSSLTTSVTCSGTATQCETVNCQATLPGGLASLSVSVADSSGLLTIDVGNGLNCAGYTEILANDFIVNFLPDPGTVGGQKTAMLNISKAAMQASANNGLSQVNICFGAPFTFPVKPGTPALQDFQGLKIGLLPNCGQPPCVADRQSVGGGARITVLAPGGDQDPRYNG
jgi:hypothetical protein